MHLREFHDQIGIAMGLAAGGLGPFHASEVGDNPSVGIPPGPINVVTTDQATSVGDFELISPYHNARLALDVDDSGLVEPADALLVINRINASDSPSLPDGSGPPYFDTDGDGSISPVDALLIINHLNRVASAEPEGEFYSGPVFDSQLKSQADEFWEEYKDDDLAIKLQSEFFDLSRRMP